MTTSLKSSPLLWGLIAPPLFILGCSSSTPGTGSTGGTSSGAGGGSDAGSDAAPPDAGDPAILVGSFFVRSTPPIPASGGEPATPGATAVLGKIYDGPSPSSLIWEKKATDGDCALLTPRVPFCNQPCGGSAVCVEDDTCQDYPLAHGAGKVTLSGLHTEAGDVDIVMSPIANGYQPPAGVKLLYPAYSEGATIRFQASGDYFAAFTLEAKGVAPLALLNDTILIEAMKPVKLTWTPPGQAGLSKIHVKLDISHHGGTKGMIECDTDDTGSLELSATLITSLVDLGVAGYPSIVVTRSNVGSTTIAAGRVDAVISSELERRVEVAGLTSCTDDTQCPAPQTCQSDLTCK